MAPGDDETMPVVVIGAGPYYGSYMIARVETGTAPHIVTFRVPHPSAQTAFVTAVKDVTSTYKELRKIEQEVHEKTHWQQFNKTAFGNKRKKR